MKYTIRSFHTNVMYSNIVEMPLMLTTAQDLGDRQVQYGEKYLILIFRKLLKHFLMLKV